MDKYRKIARALSPGDLLTAEEVADKVKCSPSYARAILRRLQGPEGPVARVDGRPPAHPHLWTGRQTEMEL